MISLLAGSKIEISLKLNYRVKYMKQIFVCDLVDMFVNNVSKEEMYQPKARNLIR